MTIEFPCPTCRQQVRTPDAAAGKKGKCPRCGGIVVIPEATGPEVGGRKSEIRSQGSGIGSRGSGIGSRGSEAIEFPCPSCRQAVRTPAAAAGKKGKCPHCQTVVQIPAASPVAPAAPQRPSAPAKSASAAKPAPKPQSPAPPKPKPAPPAKPAPQLAPLDDGNLPGLAPLGGDPFGGLTPLNDDPLAGLAPLAGDPLGGLSPLPSDPLGGLIRLPPAPQPGFAQSNPLGQAASPLNPYAAPAGGYGGYSSKPIITDGRRSGLPYERNAGMEEFWATARMVLGSPDRAFYQMRRSGGLTNPMGFSIGSTVGTLLLGLLLQFVFSLILLVVATAGGSGNGIEQAIGPFLLSFLFQAFIVVVFGTIAGIVGPFISAAIYHLLLMMFGGGHAGYEATYRVVCYGLGSVNLLGAIPCVGGLLALIWHFIVLIYGFKNAHEISGGKAALVVFFPFLLMFICGLILVFMFFASIAAALSTGGSGSSGGFNP